MTGYLYRGDPWLERVNAAIMAEREAGPVPARTGRPMGPGKRWSEAVCGTVAGVGRHRRAGEALCGECRAARAGAQRERQRRRKQEAA